MDELYGEMDEPGKKELLGQLSSGSTCSLKSAMMAAGKVPYFRAFQAFDLDNSGLGLWFRCQRDNSIVEKYMELKKINQGNRDRINDLIIHQWFTMQMVVHGESIDLGKAEGWYACAEIGEGPDRYTACKVLNSHPNMLAS